MIGKAYLKSDSDITELSHARTVIGEGGANVAVDGSVSEAAQAVVEYCQQEDCFVLHDLNSAHGTYVNDCRVQNAAVRLAPGDVIKCGYVGKSFQLFVDGLAGSTQYLPVQQRPSWTAPIQVMVTPRGYDSKSTLPLINITTPQVKTTPTPPKNTVQPHPPLRYRPHSAGSNQQLNSFANNNTQLPKEAWTYGNCMETSLRAKDQKLLRMGDELSRLAVFEQESNRKDTIISNLREELSHLHDKLSNNHFGCQLAEKLQSVEQEIESRRNEVVCLKRQLDLVTSKMHTSPTLTTQLSEKEKKIHDLRQELDALKREHIMSQGLIQSLQKEISIKDTKLQKKTEELSHVKTELKQKDVQLSSMSSKFTQLNQDKSKDEANVALTREVKDLKLKLRSLDCRAKDQLELLQNYKEEIGKLQASSHQRLEERNVAVKESEEFKQKYYEVQRQERLLRVDIEHSKSQLARFRSRLLRLIYSAPGIPAPADVDSVDDDSTFADLKKIIETRTKSQERVRELDDEVRLRESDSAEALSSHEACRTILAEMTDRISSKGHNAKLLDEESKVLLSTLSVHDSLSWVFQSFSTFMLSEKSWLDQVDNALCDAGYDLTIADENPAVHISHMHQALLHEQAELRKAVQSISELETSHQMELQSHVNKLLKENEEKLADELERIRLQEKLEFEKSMEELRAREEDKRLQAMLGEQEKINSANFSIEQLKKLLEDKNVEMAEYKERIQDSISKVELHKQAELELKHELATLENRYKMELNAANVNMEQLKRDFDNDVKQYKEEIHQHSITIVSLEEKLQMLNQKRKEAEEKMNRMKERKFESENRQRSEPVVRERSYERSNEETVVLQQTIDALKLELAHSNHQMQMQHDTIIGLRRDLSGAQARISDMTGELSESQKQELEHNRNLVKNQEIELNEIRQQLLKLSSLVDSQKEEIRKSQEQLRQNESKLRETSSTNAELDLNLREQEKLQEVERKEMERKNKIKQKEGKLSSELSAMGAQCRGERHDDVIMKQREALAELRARVKALEQTRPPIPSQEQALQQVMLLKKELSEIRAKQAMEEDKVFQEKFSLDQEVMDAHQQIKSATTQASIERTTRQQLEEAVKSSERSYMDMVNVIGGLLGFESFTGMSSMEHSPPDSRDKLCVDRRADLDKISSRMKSVLQRLERKEQLLQGYEKDLTKLREAESFASQKSGRLELMSHELMEKAEEVEHLREALVRCREALELEKRLNKLIKQRKTFHLENLDSRHSPPKARSSYQSDSLHFKAQKKQMKQAEKMKRKQYEIDVLKQRVQGKETDLCNTTAKLVNLKSSLVNDPTDEISSIYNERGMEREKERSFSYN